MKLKDAIQRMQWRFSQTKQFTPNKNDADAFNLILDYINNSVKKEVNQNELFAKLYVKMLTDYLTCLNNDVDASQKAISQTLNKPIDNLYLDFKNRFNTYAFNNFLISEGLDFNKHPTCYNEAEENVNKEVTKHKDWELYAKGIMDLDEVEMQLNWIISLNLNNYKNV